MTRRAHTFLAPNDEADRASSIAAAACWDHDPAVPAAVRVILERDDGERWLDLSPDHARQLAAHLRRCALHAERHDRGEGP